MKFLRQEQGSTAHVIIVVILVVALLGALGFIFWQNVIKTSDETTPPVSSNNTVTEAASLSTFTSESGKITFKYPNNWTVSEDVSEASSEQWYITEVDIKNEAGDPVAFLGTGAQIGGSCGPEEPTYSITTVFNDDVALSGISNSRIGYSIVDNNDGTYGAAFGLNSRESVFSVGEQELRCPSLSVNGAYWMNKVDGESSIGNLSFGASYVSPEWESTQTSTNGTYASLEEAKAYSASDEFKKIRAMISSLSVTN